MFFPKKRKHLWPKQKGTCRSKDRNDRNGSLPGTKEVQVQEKGIKPSAATGHKKRFLVLNCMMSPEHVAAGR